MTKRAAYMLRCLGQPALFTAGGEVIRIRTKKHLALLVYLAVERRRPHRRDDLAELLWPRATIGEARHSLSTALSFFRARLGRDALDAGRERILLKADRLALDIDRLLAGEALGDEFTPPLELAAFLEGFDIADAPEFAIWKDSQQARLLPAIKQALVMSMDHCRRRGDFTQIEVLAERMLALDDLSEEAVRAKMEARALAGDRVAALRVFEEWRGKLSQDLQATPSEQLEVLASSLRQRNWAKSIGGFLLNPSVQHREHPFIGRTIEYNTLYNAWDRMRNGMPGHVLVIGDSGVGKSTLVQRLATAVALEGTIVARTQCYDIDRELPYSAISALSDSLLDQPGACAVSPETLTTLAAINRRVRERFPATPPSVDSHGESARVRLTEAFLELLTITADDHPVLVIVDDLHFADDASIAVLHLALRRSYGKPIGFFFVTRPGELSTSPQASRLRENATSLGIQELGIDPLQESESHTLLEALTRDFIPQPDQAIQRVLLRVAGGYPMTLELLAQDWRANGVKSLALVIDAMTEDMSSTGPAIVAYQPLLQRLLRQLSQDAHRTLQLAALLGNRLNDIDAYSAAGLSTHEIMTGFTELINHQIIRDNGQKLEFCNELIRGVIYSTIPSSIRKKLHGQIADWFTSRSKNHSPGIGLEIAWHYIRAGKRHKAIAPLIRGARDALHRGAPHNAERALATALPALHGPQKLHATALLAEALFEQSRWHDLIALSKEIDTHVPHESIEVIHAFQNTAKRLTNTYNTSELEQLLQEMINCTQNAKNVSSKIRLAIEAASILNVLRQQAPIGLLNTVTQIPAYDLDTDNRSQLLLALAMLFYSRKEFDRSIKYIDANINLLRAHHGINSTLAMLYCGAGSIHSLHGHYSEALTSYLCSVEIALRAGNERVRSLAMANAALAYTRIGDYETAILSAENAIYYPHEFHPPAAQALILANAMLRRANSVDQAIQNYTPRFLQASPPGVQQAWNLHCADAYAMLGRTQEALTYAYLAIDHGSLVLDFCGGSYARWLAEIEHRRGTNRQTLEHLRALLERLNDFDALDQIEILWAISKTEHRLQGRPEEYLNEVRRRIESLPVGTIEQLKRSEISNDLAFP